MGLETHNLQRGASAGSHGMVHAPAPSLHGENMRQRHANVNGQVLLHNCHARLMGTQVRTVASLEAEANGSQNAVLTQKIAHLVANR